jgi:hypothetical protein
MLMSIVSSSLLQVGYLSSHPYSALRIRRRNQLASRQRTAGNFDSHQSLVSTAISHFRFQTNETQSSICVDIAVFRPCVCGSGGARTHTTDLRSCGSRAYQPREIRTRQNLGLFILSHTKSGRASPRDYGLDNGLSRIDFDSFVCDSVGSGLAVNWRVWHSFNFNGSLRDSAW